MGPPGINPRRPHRYCRIMHAEWDASVERSFSTATTLDGDADQQAHRQSGGYCGPDDDG